MKRLKKNPELADYVVEVTSAETHPSFFYFMTRKEARDSAKAMAPMHPDYRIRVFHMKFTLVSDHKKTK